MRRSRIVRHCLCETDDVVVKSTSSNHPPAPPPTPRTSRWCWAATESTQSCTSASEFWGRSTVAVNTCVFICSARGRDSSRATTNDNKERKNMASAMEEVVPEVAAPAAAGTEAPTTKRVQVRKWNAVVAWSFDIENDNCAICHNQLMVPCISCEADMQSQAQQDCSVAWGACGHSYHFHCITRWMKTRTTCPLGAFFFCARRFSISRHVCVQTTRNGNSRRIENYSLRNIY